MPKTVIITVNEGKIRGIKKKSEFSGAEYYSFFGIPYGAKQARFKDPVRAKPWKNILNGTVEKEGCMQFSLRLKRNCGSEDCFYNNIHTPKLPSEDNALKPVIFQIHPGGFVHGSPETWYYGSPEYIMHNNIVYVCVAHRLHMLGFLNLETEACSGNQGLKDIILSLQWLKENISSFGGDPNNITLLGSSIGSTAIHLLMLSPAAEGLFHKAVMMGSYAFNPVYNILESNIPIIIEMARAYGFDVTNMDPTSLDINDKKKLNMYLKKFKVGSFIMTRPERTFVFDQNYVQIFPTALFMPTVDTGEHAVLPLPHRELIKSTARIPVMYGICERESVMGFCKVFRGSTMANFYTTFKQNRWGWGYNIGDNDVELIKEKIDSFYLKDCPIEYAPLPILMDIQTDAAQSDIYESLIDVIAADLPSSVYIYKFQFEGNACTMKDKLSSLLDEPVEGTFHAADYSYWSCVKDHWEMTNEVPTPQTKEMITTFTKLISTFAKNGDPNYQGLNEQWMPSTPQNPRYLSINNELQMVDGKLNGERMEFWENLKKQFFKE